MADEGVKRRLTTILAADVESYTRLVHAEEEKTVTILGELREVIDGLITRYNGRIFNTGGDSVLAEFRSAVEAVRCAVSWQEAISVRNTGISEDRQLKFRIGINVGDVMVKGDDLFGDGVNLAARLEGLSQPGGICISNSVHEQVKHKMPLRFEDMGPQTVKNIAEPISAFRVLLDFAPPAPPVKTPESTRRSWIMTVAAAVLLSVAVAEVIWWSGSPDEVPFSGELDIIPRLDRPSVAVLPFDNMSADPEQEYFVDGMTEDLITRLANVSGLFVIARNSVFTYKGKNVKIRDIGRDLGVRYVLEGSVRRSGNRIRVNAQLIDANNGGHLWAETFDRDLKDVFEVIAVPLTFTGKTSEYPELDHPLSGRLEAMPSGPASQTDLSVVDVESAA